MDIEANDQKTQSISDDQELAKVLAGISDDASDDAATEPVESALPPVPAPAAPAPADDAASSPIADPVAVAPTPVVDPGLDAIKQQALGELRPLVDKLNVAPEEKFDTYLLLLRSTDDKELIAPAHQAATEIADEARRAQALLDIIKEIDFLSQSQK